MLTSCPECKTTFRLTQEQLSLRRGLVRCGRCKAVFNAYHTLLPDLVEPEVAAEPEPAPATEEPSPPLAPAMDLAEAAETPPPPEPLASIHRALAELPPQVAEPGEETAADRALNPPTIHDILLSELPTRKEPAGSPWKPLLYALLALLLSLLLLLQAAYFLRSDLAALAPDTRPLLETLCTYLDCSVPLPRQLDKRAIVASSLEHDAERAAHVRLTVLLANRSGTVQAWPHLLLTLLDLQEAPVAIKTFPPSVYLPSGLEEDAGMGTGSEAEVRLELELGKLQAAGYTVDLVYPQ
jgi:predicted Zn finger-like uncharacterized protein